MMAGNPESNAWSLQHVIQATHMLIVQMMQWTQQAHPMLWASSSEPVNFHSAWQSVTTNLPLRDCNEILKQNPIMILCDRVALQISFRLKDMVLAMSSSFKEKTNTNANAYLQTSRRKQCKTHIAHVQDLNHLKYIDYMDQVERVGQVTHTQFIEHVERKWRPSRTRNMFGANTTSISRRANHFNHIWYQ